MPSLILSTRTWIELVERCSSTWTRIVLEVWIKKTNFTLQNHFISWKIMEKFVKFCEHFYTISWKIIKKLWNFVYIFVSFHEKFEKVWKNSWFFLYIFILFHEKIEKVWKNSWYFVYIFKLQVPYKNHEILLKFS